MATNVQRLKAIADALINGSATNAQIERIAAAFYPLAPPTVAGEQGEAIPVPYEQLTNEQKAGVVLFVLRKKVVGQVKHHEADLAAQAAAEQVRGDVDAGFVETP